MVTLPLGVGAYERLYAGEPVIRLENRFMETDPTNLREHITLLSRPGTNQLVRAPATVNGLNRGNFSKIGLFDGDLFITEGTNFYRYNTAGLLTPITGIVNGTGFPVIAWMKGIGYEYLFISDGLLLQFYNGGTHATGTLTLSGSITNQVIQINGVYYSWNASVDTNAPDGSSAHPWLANPGADPILAMANLINFNGVRGVDFSTNLGGPNPLYSAATTGGPPATALVITATSPYTDANSYATTVLSGTGIAWSHATLTGGGTHALQGVPVPDGVGIRSLTALSGFVLASVAASQKFFWIEPGATTIDPLNFAEKESNPDNISDMVTVGDNAIICGEGSTENWYATGDFNAPFLPVEGRVYKRGFIAGTPTVVKDSMIGVGDDGVVYSIGYGYGDTSQYGVHRISNHGIEERIRVQLRREQGIPP